MNRDKLIEIWLDGHREGGRERVMDTSGKRLDKCTTCINNEC